MPAYRPRRASPQGWKAMRAVFSFFSRLLPRRRRLLSFLSPLLCHFEILRQTPILVVVIAVVVAVGLRGGEHKLALPYKASRQYEL